MLKEGGGGSDTGSPGGGPGADRRKSPRRALRFGTGAVLQVNGTSHIVAVVDVSATGAYVATRACVSGEQSLVLKLFLAASGVELRLPCEVVRATQQAESSGQRRPGVALRFRDLDPDTQQRLQHFAERGRRGSRR